MTKIISTGSPHALGSPFQAHQGEQTQAQPTSNELSKFGLLPDEVLLLIFKALAPRDLPKLNLVSKRFKEVLSLHPDIKFVKEIFMPAMQKREQDRLEFTMGLQWGIVSSHVYARIKEEIETKGLSLARQASFMAYGFPFAQNDAQLSMSYLGHYEYHYHFTKQPQTLVVDLGNINSFLNDKQLASFFERMSVHSLTIKGGDTRQLKRLMPYLVSKAPQFTSLDVSYSCMTPVQLDEIVSATINLKNLFISGLSPECVSIASKCQGLEILVGSLLPGPAVEITESLDHLKLLELCYDWPSDRSGNSILKLCPNVEFLNVSWTRINGIKVILDSCPKLISLDITASMCSEMMESDFENFVELISLTKIETLCSHVVLSDEQINLLFSTCKALKCYKLRTPPLPPYREPLLYYFDSYYLREEGGIVKHTDLPPPIPSIETLLPFVYIVDELLERMRSSTQLI